MNSFTIKNPAISEKHEIIERKMPLSPWTNSNSPTALGLLLRSSLFKELVEKTTTSGADEEEKDEKPTHDDEDGEFAFYGGDDREFSRASKIERGQSFWNAC